MTRAFYNLLVRVQDLTRGRTRKLPQRSLSLVNLQISPASRSKPNLPDPQLMTRSMNWIRSGLIALIDLKHCFSQNLLTSQSRPFRLPKLYRPTPPPVGAVKSSAPFMRTSTDQPARFASYRPVNPSGTA